MSSLNNILRTFLKLVFQFCGKILIYKDAHNRKNILKKWDKIKKDLISEDLQPQGYEAQKEHLFKVANNSKEELFLAQTSGTRNLPKVIPFTKSRLKKSQTTFLKAMMVLTHPFNTKKTFFVISSLEEETSLTAGLLKQRDPSHIELLQAPYRYLTTRRGQRLRQEIGLYPARLSLMMVTNPRFLYATNPSTLTHFFDELLHNWAPIKSNLEKLLKSPHLLKELLKLEEGEALERLKEIVRLDKPPTLAQVFPELKAVITWDGGYVAPYSDKLKTLLPDVTHIPMYSMSTESIETLPHRDGKDLYFLPTMSDTYPEFLREGKLYSPLELKKGETYGLVVTTTFGLLRYDTQDEFLVVGHLNGLPDIRFKRRRNITASMTGEKISEEQCHLMFESLRNHFKLQDFFLTLYGNARDGQFRYELGLIGLGKNSNLPEIAEKAQELLSMINEEYKSKTDSGRLSPLLAREFTLPEFAKLMGQELKWESQFKVMPLYEKPLR